MIHENSKVNQLTSKFQSKLVDFRIPKSTDPVTYFVIPKSSS